MARIIANFAAFCSILGLYFSVSPISVEKSLIEQSILIASAIFITYVLVVDICAAIRENRKQYPKQNDINEYMKKWVGQQGRTVILTRDMSWSNTKDVQQILKAKAQSNELTILIETKTELTKELEEFGGNIVEYGRHGFVPRTRLTVCDYERHGSRIAVATKKSGKHIISELDEDNEPAFSLAHDLVRILLNARKY